MKCDCRICVNNKNGRCSTFWMGHIDSTGKCMTMSTDPADCFENKWNQMDRDERAVFVHMINSTYGASTDNIHDMYPETKLIKEDSDNE